MTTARATLSLLWVAVCVLPSLAALPGQTAPSSTANTPTFDTSNTLAIHPDDLYDYEVWAADYDTFWYLIITWRDGHVSEWRYPTEESAMDKAEWLWFHHEQVAAIEFDPRYELGPYVYVETYDTHQQAVNIATLFETAGYVADIRKVSQKYFAASAGGTPMLKTVTSRSLLK